MGYSFVGSSFISWFILWFMSMVQISSFCWIFEVYSLLFLLFWLFDLFSCRLLVGGCLGVGELVDSVVGSFWCSLVLGFDFLSSFGSFSSVFVVSAFSSLIFDLLLLGFLFVAFFIILVLVRGFGWSSSLGSVVLGS